MPLRFFKHSVYVTKNRFKNINGFLIPIFNVHDGFIEPQNYPKQVYITVCDVNEIKGPHLHKKRWGYFTCIQGDAKIIVKTEAGYEEYYTGENYDYTTIEVPAGIPSAIQNIGVVPAYILNMPSPSWHINDQDDYDVSFDETVFNIENK